MTPPDALDKTRLYMANYAHAEPFDPTRLLDVWNRCGSDEDSVEMCRPGVEAARGLVARGHATEVEGAVRFKVPEGKTAKNRVHIDVEPTEGTRD